MEDAFLVVVGVTQEMIDETRLSTETRMLTDMKYLSEKGESLMYRGRNGETPVSLGGGERQERGDAGKSRGGGRGRNGETPVSLGGGGEAGTGRRR